MALETQATLEAALATLADQSMQDPQATILPERDSIRPFAPGASGIELGATLGQGGMGIVHSARQRALERPVAVKTLRSDHVGDARLERRLLQEAWTTGRLEHPNIVPIYDIRQGDQGQPLVVLKHIVGATWRVGNSEEEDPLEADLRILMQVCQAVHFAHQRGFVHRDIKPENVMVGDFGEVYLLDWGIAVATDDDGTGRYPLASEATTVAGTPAYMAPEMLGGENPRIGPWTDVYLLGAVLYELLSGAAPHDGENMSDILRSVITRKSAPEDANEPELWRICLRAMDPDPDARFESAEQLRLAFAGYLRHRDARRVAEAADESFAALRRAVAEEASDHTIDAAFAECRFGYRAALQSWPDFDEARERLQRAELYMARVELDNGRPEAAQRLVDTMTDAVDDALRADIARAVEAKASERAAMERYVADADQETGRRTRAFVVALLSTAWILGPLIRHYTHLSAASGVMLDLSMIGFAGGLFYWARESLFRSKFNRALVAVVGAVVLSDFWLGLNAFLSGASSQSTELMMPFIWLCGALMAWWTISRTMWPTVIAMATVALAGTRWPEWRSPMASAANLVVFLNAIWANRSIALLRETLSRRGESGQGSTEG